MKNLLVIMLAVCLTGIAGAWGLDDAENPYTFDGPDGSLLTDQIPDVWGTWGGDDDANGDIVVSDGVCTFTTNSWELAFCHDNAIQDIGNPVPGVDDVEVILTVVSVSGPGYVSMKIECYDETDAFPNNDDGGGSIQIYDFEAAGLTFTSPGIYTFNTSDLALSNAGPIPAGTVAITPVIVVAGGTNKNAAVGVIDEIWLGKAGTYMSTKATSPNPSNGSIVGSSLDILSWTNPEPFNTAEAIICDVYFLDGGESPLPEDPNLGPDLVHPDAKLIADNLPAEMLDLNDAMEVVLPLNDEHYYYWAVHCTDPNNGVSITTQGDIWYFYTGDAVPVVDAGPDQFMWLSQDDSELDGGNDPNVRWFKVVGTYTDDGKSEIVDANFVNLNWGWNPDDGEFGIIEVSDVHDKDTQTVTAVYKTVYAEGGDPDMSTAIPGYWNIELRVTDGIGTGRDSSYHRIDEDCLSAAENDPSDDYDGAGDFNRDCKKDLADLAVFATGWLECNALKLDDCP
jgi:hypothetical protein